MTVVGTTPARQSLTRADCLALLAPGGRGRIAASMRAVPVIIPVHFVLCGDDVVFNPSSAGSSVATVSRAVADCVVAFETDDEQADGRPAWDVHVTGVATAFSSDTPPAGFRLSSELIYGWRAGG